MTGSAWILFGLIVGIVGKLLIPRRDPRFYTDNSSGYYKRIDRWHCRTAVGFLFPGAADGFVMAIVGSIVLLLLAYRIVVGRSTRATVRPSLGIVILSKQDDFSVEPRPD
jgi:uncharacterized membrane protein YeaQ/YmgE (transglycosylase-associated protein family)